MSSSARRCLLAAGGAGVLAAGLRSLTGDAPRIVAAAVVLVPAVATYVLATAMMGVPEARLLLRRFRLRR
jgi:hypothetical protein